MKQIWSMGELLCEIMRPREDMPLEQPGEFLGPFPSGAPAIFVDTVARLGIGSGVIGGVGDDDFGSCLLSRLKKDGVNTSLIEVHPNGSTGVAFVTYFSDGSRRFLYHFPDTPATWAKAPASEQIPDDVGYFHIMGCSLMATAAFGQEILSTMRRFMEKGARVSFDPNIRPELLRSADGLEIARDVWRNSAVFFPGEAELQLIAGVDDIDQAIAHCFANPTLEILALKCGSRGARIITRDGDFTIGVYPVTSKDATGAGDSFDGAFLAGLVQGKSIEEAAKMAAAAGAINTAAFGPMEGDIRPETLADMMQHPMKGGLA